MVLPSSRTSRVVFCALYCSVYLSDPTTTTNAFVTPSTTRSTRIASPLSAYLDVQETAPAVPPKSNKNSNTNTNRDYPPISESPVDTTSLGTLTVPQVGVGTISWSADKASDRYELERLMETGSQHPSGLLLDTAERYGSNLKTALGLGWGETERLTRRLVSKSPATAKQIIATKFTPSPWRTTEQSVVEACQESRERLLGPDSDAKIDLYQLHMPDIVQPMSKFVTGFKPSFKDKIYWDGLAECYHQGLVENVGVCNYGPTLLMECQEHLARKGVPLASNQIAYSILGRHNGAQATLEKGQELGIQTLAFFPFAMGLLTGKYNNLSLAKASPGALMTSSLQTSRRSRLEEYDLYRYALGDGDSIPKGGITRLLAVMQEIADAHDATLAQVALNFIICQGGIPIPGARTEEQFRDNMGAMGWRLTFAEMSRLEEESDKLGFGFEGAGFKRTSEKFVGYGVEKWTLD